MSIRGNLTLILRVVALTLLVFTAACAQNHPSATTATDSAQTIQFLKTGLFMISGAGGNTVVRLSGNGIILVDGKLPGNYGPLVAKVRRIADELPIRVLINTNQDAIHTGTNVDFLKAGIPVVAHANVKGNLMAHPSSEQDIALPSATFDGERSIKLGGVTVQLLHYGNAHTSGDTVVYFPDLKVVAVGDLLPDADVGEGGSLVTWGPVLGQILKLDFDTVVPGRGPVLARADLEASKARMDSLVSHAARLLKSGVPRKRLLTELRTDAAASHFSAKQLDELCRELSGVRAAGERS
jgi:glyoxylase-like metal-dependent hydrolase (beta-lactamase superfamily II)